MATIPLTDNSPWWLEYGLSELNRIQPPERNKKVNTIIALIDARLAGESDASVFRRADCVSRDVWYKKWSKDAVISSVLDNIKELIRPIHDKNALLAMSAAATNMQLASPLAVRRAISLMDSLDEAVSLRAAFGLLDRAGIETAAKNTTNLEGDIPIITVPPGLVEKLKP